MAPGSRGTAPPECAAFRAALAAGSPIDQAHVAECEACAALLDRELGGSIADPPPPAEDPLVRAVMAKIRADKAPLPRMPTRARRALVGAAVVGSAGIAWALGAGPRSPLDPVGALLAAAVGAPVALHPLHEPAPRWAGARVAVALGVPLVAGLAPPLDGPFGVEGLADGAGCFVRGLCVAVLVLGVLGATERRVVGPLLVWLGGAALAGSAATLALALWCPAGATLHRVFGHGAPGIVVAGLVAGGIVAWRRFR